MVGRIFKELLKEKGKACTMDEEGAQNFLAQIGSRGVYGFQAQKMCSHC